MRYHLFYNLLNHASAVSTVCVLLLTRKRKSNNGNKNYWKKSPKHKNTVIKIHAGDSITLAFLAHWAELGIQCKSWSSKS